MPYEGASDSSLPTNVKKLSKSARKQWVEVFNSSIAAGDDEGTAFTKANGVVKTKDYVDEWDVESRQLSQEAAGYTPYGANSEGGCANCRWYVSPDSCILVWGDIAPTGRSKLWYNAASEAVVAEPIPVTIVKEEVNPVKKALQSVAKALHLVPSNEDDTVEPTILFTKTSDGSLRFFTSFTNCFKDLQGEIITTTAHKDYVFWATQKEQYPDLWLWHAGPQSKFGKTDWLEFSDGFVLASGIIDADKEYIAEAIQKENVKVSHGFYGVSNEAKEIVAYRTFEISVLPAANAANPYTSFNIAKETVMPFSPAKREWLKTVGNMDDTKIAEWEASLGNMAKSLEALGIEYKEVIEDTISAEVASYVKAMDSVVEVVKQLKITTDAQAEAITKLQTEVSKNIADQVEAAFLAKIAQTPSGKPATESKENITSKESDQKDYSWFTEAINSALK